MNHFSKPAARFIACICLLLSNTSTAAKSADPRPANRKTVPVIELNGHGYERGLQHGRLLKKEIAEIYEKWKANIANELKTNPDSVIKNFYLSTNFEPITKRLTPAVYQEIKGIAKGSGQSFIDVFCFQLVDEFWVYIDRLHHEGHHHCSGIGIAAKNHQAAFIAQNMDVENYMNGYQVLLHIKANSNEPEQYLMSCAGLVALNGVNSYGIGVCVNTLMELNASTDGLPVAFMIRGILACKNGSEARKFLTTTKHASGQNYILGAGDSVYDFEASSGKVIRFLPHTSNPWLVYHTNHAIANDDIKPWYKESHKKLLLGVTKNDNSLTRFCALKSHLDHATDAPGDELIKQTLRSKDDAENPVCRAFGHEKYGFTFSSDIITLGNKPSIQLTYASPDQSDYVVHYFDTEKKDHSDNRYAVEQKK